MRAALTTLVIASIIALGPVAAAADVRAGKYVCRTPAGTETGSTFRIGANGAYGDADGNALGSVVNTSGELRFDGGEKDGSRALIISETRVKVGKRIFCEWEAPKPEPAPAAAPNVETPAVERPGAKLIVVDPGLRR